MENPSPLHPNPKVAEALAFLQAAEQSAQSGTPTGLVWAVQQYDYAIERLTAVEAEAPEFRRWLGLAWLGRGNVILNRRKEDALTEGVQNFDKAIEVFQRDGAPDANLRANDEANVWMARGLALAAAGAEKVAEALRSFDQALALRKTVANGEPPEVKHAVALGWVSRADVLLRSGGAERLGEAVQNLDEALVILKSLPYTEHAGLRHQVAMALMNRGIAVQNSDSEGVRIEEAFGNLEEAANLLRGQTELLQQPEGKHLLACVLLNLGGVMGRRAGAQPAVEVRTAAKEVLSVLGDDVEAQFPLSEVALRARHLLVRASADLAEGQEVEAEAKEFLSDATDAVDEGLALIKVWEKRNVPAFRPFAVELFCLGAVLYQKHQPQFLAEYILEVLDPERSQDALGGNEDMYKVALEALNRAIQAHQHYSFSGISDPAVAKKLETLKELRDAETRLKVLLAPKPNKPQAN